MSEIDDSKTTKSYLERYRKKLAALEQVGNNINQAQSELMSLEESRQRLQSEVREMRRVITRMVDQGVDAVQAQLIGQENNRSNLWGHDDYTISIDLSNQSIFGTTGATGAIGAVGSAISNGGYITLSGANGPTGSYDDVTIEVDDLHS